VKMNAAASFLSNGKIESPETGHASASAGKKSLASHYFLSSRVQGARSWRDKKLLSRSGRDRTRVLLGHWNFRCAAAGAEQLHSRRLCLRRAISSLNFVSCLATTVRATRSARQICMAARTRNLLAAHDNNSDNKRCERRVSFYSPAHKIISSLNPSVISRLVLSASPLALPLALSLSLDSIRWAGAKAAASEWTDGAIESAVSTIFWCCEKAPHVVISASIPRSWLGD
jgi:hypothetical protein